ncbi:MAG: hypothetical protein EA362_07355 [Saprospirales bacterium]|nr:MAG: hypothetical protein EA362_07355 [Saprospirales bacterium]
MNRKNYHTDPIWLLLLLVSIAITTGLYWYSSVLNSVSIGEVSAMEIVVRGNGEVYMETGFIGPLMESPADEIEDVEEEEVIIENPPFDSIRPFPKSHLPEHIDSMWFYVSESELRPTIDSIKLLINNKEMSLVPTDQDFGFFNYLNERLDHNISFQDLTLNGYPDIKIMHWASGATGNNLFSVFLYHDKDTTYRHNQEFSRHVNIGVGEDGYYYTMSTGGGRNYGGQIMVLDDQNDSFLLKPIVQYTQKMGRYPVSTNIYQTMKFNFDSIEISYIDTFPSHLAPEDSQQFQSVFQMNKRVKYHHPKIHCSTNIDENFCTLSFQSRLNEHKIELFVNIENKQLVISDNRSLEPIQLEMIFNSREEDIELNKAYIKSAFSFYENWKSPPKLHLLIRSANIELVDKEEDWNYSFHQPLRVW